MAFNYRSYTSIDEILEDCEYLLKKREMLLTRIVVDKPTGCWNYTGYKTPKGRAKTQIGNKSIATARLAYVVFNQKPIGGNCVCHSCDNPSCINPEHLWLGTQLDNIKDRNRKKRTGKSIGKANAKCRLSDEDVREIRRLSIAGLPTSDIAGSFGISYQHAHGIIKCKQRRYVE